MKLWLRKQQRLNKRHKKCNKRVYKCSRLFSNNSNFRLNKMLSSKQCKPKMALKMLKSKDYSNNKLMPRQWLQNNRLKSKHSKEVHSH